MTHLASRCRRSRRPTAPAQGAICLFSDLTHGVELEEQLRLKEALARLGELTAGIAHEFRNGLATIHGYSRLIAPTSCRRPTGPYVDGIRQETEALGHVVTNFLKFARPEQVVFAPVELEPVVRRAADELAHELPPTPSSRCAATFGDIEGDEVLLRQVFGNLIRNAAEACQAAGVAPRIDDLRAGRRAHLPHRAWTTTARACPRRRASKIFQPFFTTRSRGTGLGLAIVQKLVVTHNGRVDRRRVAARRRLVPASTFPLRAGEAETRRAEAVEIG